MDTQYQQFWHLMMKKKSTVYIIRKIALEMFVNFLREYTKNIFDFEKEMLPLTKEELKIYSNKINEELKKRFKSTLRFLIMISVNLFCCQEKVFILISK